MTARHALFLSLAACFAVPVAILVHLLWHL